MSTHEIELMFSLTKSQERVRFTNNRREFKARTFVVNANHHRGPETSRRVNHHDMRFSQLAKRSVDES